MRRTITRGTSPIPDEILDLWMALLSASQFKVIMYVARKTYGWGKTEDAISLRQLFHGTVRGDGEVIDRGTGLNERTILSVLKELSAVGVLNKASRQSASGENFTTMYSINLSVDIEAAAKELQNRTRKNAATPVQKLTEIEAKYAVSVPHVPAKIQVPVSVEMQAPVPVKVPDTGYKEENKDSSGVTFNVVPETVMKFSLSKAKQEAVTEIIKLTGESKSRKRWEQIYGLADNGDEIDTWNAAVAQLRAKLSKGTEQVPNPGAYFNATATRMLAVVGVIVPTGSAGDRTEARNAILESMGNAE